MEIHNVMLVRSYMNIEDFKLVGVHLAILNVCSGYN